MPDHVLNEDLEYIAGYCANVFLQDIPEISAMYKSQTGKDAPDLEHIKETMYLSIKLVLWVNHFKEVAGELVGSFVNSSEKQKRRFANEAIARATAVMMVGLLPEDGFEKLAKFFVEIYNGD